MKTILVYGDSNTWGYIPGTEAERYAHDVRWAGVMRAELGGDYRVIEEALNGRTTAWDDPLMADRNGRTFLPMVLDSQAPVDLVVIMLGTNDTKHYFGFSANDIALGAASLVQFVKESMAGPGKRPPEVLLVSPVTIVESDQPFGHKFDDAIETSRGFAASYREIAEQLDCLFFDAAVVAIPPETDGIHLDADGHSSLGQAMAQFVSQHL